MAARAEQGGVVVELCGKLADPSGRTLALAIPPTGCTAAELIALVGRHDPALGALIATTRVRVCINDNLVGQGAMIAPGDAVALLPPVSGG